MGKYNSVKKACETNDIIFKEIVNNFNFRTEKDISNYILKKFKQFKVKKAYDPIVANNSIIIHLKPRNKKLERGFLILDFACKVNGYCSDVTRTLFIGKANSYEKMLYNLVLNCQRKCISKLKLNYSYADLEIYARVLLKNYKMFFVHSLGHGLGKKVHGSPVISVISKDKVTKGQFITIELGIYFKDKKEIGIRVEDTIYIGNKVEVLSKSSKKLIEIY
ncbi:MAG: M24 family metallopeptidase [Nanoarchaeota archaeon]